MSTRDAYLAAADELMADADPSRLAIPASCQHVGAASGSSDHQFGILQGFVAAPARDPHTAGGVAVGRVQELATLIEGRAPSEAVDDGSSR